MQVPSNPSVKSRLTLFAPWVVFFVTFGLYVGANSIRHLSHLGGDEPAYLLAARYNPLTDNFDNPSHGWGYPLAIKALGGLTRGDELHVALLISAFSAALIAFFGVRIAFRTLPIPLALCASGLLTINPILFSTATTAMSDAFFGAVAWCSISLCFERSKPPGYLSMFVAGFLAVISIFIRGNGLPLLPALPVAWLLCAPSPNKRRIVSFPIGAVAGFVAA